MRTSLNLPNRVQKELSINDTTTVVVSTQVIGKGSYSKILLGWNLRNKEQVAIKVQPYQEAADIEHEIKQMKKAGLYLGQHIDSTSPTPVHYLVMPYISGKSFETLYTSSIVFSEEETIKFMLLTSKSLQSIHALNLVHNDIHEGNLILDEDKNKATWVDFAFAIDLPEGDQIKKIKLLESPTPVYKAPESNTQRGYSTDIYQLGFMLLRMHLILTSDDFHYREKLADSREFSLSEIKRHTHRFMQKPETAILVSALSDDWLERPTVDRIVVELTKANQRLAAKPPRLLK